MNPFQSLAPAVPDPIASRVYPITGMDVSPVSTVAPAAVDTAYFYAFRLPFSISATAFYCRVQTGGAASAVKFAIYADSPVSHRPLGAALSADDTGSATTASTTTVQLTNQPAVTLLAGKIYWCASKFTGTLPILWSIYSSSMFTQSLVGGTSAAVNAVGYSKALAYGTAWPTYAEGDIISAAAACMPVLWLSK